MGYREGVVVQAEFDDQALPVAIGKAVVKTSEGEVQALWYEGQVIYKSGDKVTLTELGENWQITGYDRGDTLTSLFLGFVVLVVLVTRIRGIMSLLSLTLSFVILFFYTIPAIILGANPLFVVILTSLGIIGATYYLAHGISRKTHAAALGTLLTIAVVAALTHWFAVITHLTGMASEEALFVSVEMGAINIIGILVAGIILGTVGVLDDITISQASIVNELYEANKKLSRWELYKRAMRVGRDHISSLVNTMVLVYTGSALPLTLLFHNAQISYREFVNYEAVTTEIVRMLVGSIGLVLAVPLTTIIAAWMIRPNPLPKA